jgi:1A family penicillin-binding protein
MRRFSNWNRIRVIRYIRAIFFFGFFAFSLLTISLFCVLIYAKMAPVLNLNVAKTSVFFATDGSVIGESNGEKRYWIPINDVPIYIQNATIAIEDQHFEQHHGFDVKRTLKVAIADLLSMSKKQGASTITQQYARNLYLSHDKTWTRKIQEALYALRLESHYSKNEILEGYLNTIYYGHGAYGIEAASRLYFNKSARALTLAEASMLVGIPKGPSTYSPYLSIKNATTRQHLVLAAMVEQHKLSTLEEKKALQEKIYLQPQKKEVNLVSAPAFLGEVKKQLLSLPLTDEERASGGLHIYTTLDPVMQNKAKTSVSNAIAATNDLQIGFVAMDPKNGYVKALIGGRYDEPGSFNRATQAIRQPGSTIKPLLYYAALEHGFTPSTKMKSEPTTFKLKDGKSTYSPHNFNQKYGNREVTLAQALALSDNIYAVKTHLFLGEKTLVKTAKRFGITTPMKPVPSLALGTSGVRVIDMVNAYGMLDNGGKEIKPHFITKITKADGTVLFQSEVKKNQVLDKRLSFVMTDMLTGLFDPKLNDYTQVTGTTLLPILTRKYAGKSGTTNTDYWMIGYTPQLVSGVWTGYDDGHAITLQKDKMVAKSVWAHFMESALQKKQHLSFSPPKGVKRVLIDPQNGKLSNSLCPVTRWTYFVKGTEPVEWCQEHLLNTRETKAPLKDKKPSFFDWLIPW